MCWPPKAPLEPLTEDTLAGNCLAERDGSRHRYESNSIDPDAARQKIRIIEAGRPTSKGGFRPSSPPWQFALFGGLGDEFEGERCRRDCDQDLPRGSLRNIAGIDGAPETQLVTAQAEPLSAFARR